jgi:homoaconitase/3-isopropylmalate dehydratase large subunit
MSPRKKIPTKAELLQLQKLYKTDEKIGERLGGVPSYLVAYWRRKKNVPKYSLPKFSESEIRNLWERFGDDDKCGLELGISKAAFYNWRRRYGLREKPAFLKLEQLELNFPGMKTRTTSASLYGKQCISQKILAHLAELEKVEVGQKVTVEPDLVVSHLRTREIIDRFGQLSSDYVWNAGKIAVVLRASAIGGTPGVADDNRITREFARRHNIRHFYDFNMGSCHQLVLENGLLKPGQLGVGSDRLAISYGCLSTLAIYASVDEMASIWSDGKIEVEVPPSIRIDINGRRVRSVSAKDVGLYMIKQLSGGEINGRALEYYGSVISHMSVGERFTLANLSAGAGATAAICHFDSATRRYLTTRATGGYAPVIADKDAVYGGMYQINTDQLIPQIAGPNTVEKVRAVAELEGTPVHQIILGTCSSGRFEDLRIGADILKGKKISRDCRLLVIPGSRTVYLDALKKGLIRAYVEAGAIIMNPGFQADMDAIAQSMAASEKCLTTIGSLNSTGNDTANGLAGRDIYICSPATAAASALSGSITDPTRFLT